MVMDRQKMCLKCEPSSCFAFREGHVIREAVNSVESETRERIHTLMVEHDVHRRQDRNRTNR